MRITDVRTVLYEFPWRRPIGDVQLPTGARTMAEVAVFLATDEELVGDAVASPAARPFVHGLAEELMGRDPRAVRGPFELMQRLAFTGGPSGRAGWQRAALRACQGSCGRRT